MRSSKRDKLSTYFLYSLFFGWLPVVLLSAVAKALDYPLIGAVLLFGYGGILVITFVVAPVIVIPFYLIYEYARSRTYREIESELQRGNLQIVNGKLERTFPYGRR